MATLAAVLEKPMAVLSTAAPTLATPEPTPDKFQYKFSGSVDYPSAETANMVMNTLAVDPELHPDDVTRELAVEGSTFIFNFAATEPRMLRAAVGTFYDLLGLTTKTIERFGGNMAGA